MTGYLLDHPARLAQHLAANHTVLTPQSSASGAAHWLRYQGGEAELASGFARPLYGPKQFFFADREQLFEFDGQRFVERKPAVCSQVLFGVPPCDLEALAYQDRFFAPDPHYTRRREVTLLVGVDCTERCEQGFCQAVDAGPQVKDATADLALSARAGGWTLRVTSARGAEAVAGLVLPEVEPTAPSVVAFPDSSHIDAGIRRLQADAVPSEVWEQLGLRCLSCSGCTNLCPTCSCFTVWDRPTAAASVAFARERVWDCCLYEGFQREASGHHPAATPGRRVQRFWQHKFSLQTVQDGSRYGCVGCGRCEVTCPAVLGVQTVLRRIAS